MDTSKIQLCDYAVAFIDLLGQRTAMSDRHLPDDKDLAIAVVKKSVGRILDAQNRFESFYNTFTLGDSVYSRLPLSFQQNNPDMAPAKLSWQRFSDGFVVYVPLGKGLVDSPANSLLGLILASGCYVLWVWLVKVLCVPALM